jgi:hypothetical protein
MANTKIGGEKSLPDFNPKHFPVKEWLGNQLMGRGSRPMPTEKEPISYKQLAQDYELSGINSSVGLSKSGIKKCLQTCIRELRMVDMMPISGTGPGLWVCQTPEDIMKYHTSLSNRIASQVNLLTRVAKWKINS